LLIKSTALPPDASEWTWENGKRAKTRQVGEFGIFLNIRKVLKFSPRAKN
jgi:hypothetical protein